MVETKHLWGEGGCRVWIPDSGEFVWIGLDKLRPATAAVVAGRTWLAYVAAGACVAEALSQDTVLAPIESSVIPLPHQIRALARATAGSRVRYLLADEVGLGKTIEAGLIMRELKLRGVVRRTLVVAPKGLVNQWVAEMRTHFAEEFEPSSRATFRRSVGSRGRTTCGGRAIRSSAQWMPSSRSTDGGGGPASEWRSTTVTASKT